MISRASGLQGQDFSAIQKASTCGIGIDVGIAIDIGIEVWQRKRKTNCDNRLQNRFRSRQCFSGRFERLTESSLRLCRMYYDSSFSSSVSEPASS